VWLVLVVVCSIGRVVGVGGGLSLVLLLVYWSYCGRSFWCVRFGFMQFFVRKMGNNCSFDQRGLKEHCVFCRIVSHEEQENRILFENDLCIAFKDIRPDAEFHFLVIPKEHVHSVDTLTVQHLPLVQDMLNVGKQLVETHIPENLRTTVKFGYHVPPFTSVDHLHMHVLAGKPHSYWSGHVSFAKNTPWFITAEQMINKLQKQQR